MNGLRIQFYGGSIICKNAKFQKKYLSPYGQAQFRVPKCLRETSNQNIVNKFLEFNFREGLFYANNPKSKFLGIPLAPGMGSDQNVVNLTLKGDYFMEKMSNSNK
jgi:hypothetical protein